jgi:glycerol-3-phosphate O-acyltransferase/dihydroxyacetone phosphate acyltransferase
LRFAADDAHQYQGIDELGEHPSLACFKRKFIGFLARSVGTLPVARAMDNLKPGTGTIYLATGSVPTDLARNPMNLRLKDLSAISHEIRRCASQPGTGTIYLPDPINQPTLLRGVGTNFEGKGFERDGTP